MGQDDCFVLEQVRMLDDVIDVRMLFASYVTFPGEKCRLCDENLRGQDLLVRGIDERGYVGVTGEGDQVLLFRLKPLVLAVRGWSITMEAQLVLDALGFQFFFWGVIVLGFELHVG
eukprot:CAMPEP_0175893220 /NCGR_PEP_ID=MMETSP0107_2-20121207/49338_1 /TAXON_ID=195067 ORGANISM="Goniomonas pacifica, Strain CCMP1869" /NCGR_SAMPLE_ID=MMETSP0107_2 /ASSEMBLY_ACC=CAM_ASM_000203 /LENGTH=115 /DNA_ID=CAMNT_0017214223 /DNA_START=149 /DNA_END=496 /DNA_ORIENTATION=+